MGEHADRILMTADPIGGVWTYAIALARRLCRRGASVALATMGAPLTAGQRREAEAIPGLELFASDYRLEWMDDPWDDVDAAGAWLLQLEASWQPDVIHLNGYAHAALPWTRPVLVVAHSCVPSWWTAVRGDAVPAKYDEYRRRVKAGLEAARMVVAPTRAMLDALRAEYGVTGAQRVIANGLEPVVVDHRTREPWVLSVGRLWDRAKNVELLAGIAGDLPWPVMLAGETSPPDGYGRRWPGVRLPGRIEPPALARLYDRAGVYALPALYEPFGLSVLEAAQHGCPLVLGDIPSLRELWDGAALFVDPRSPAAWAVALRRMVDDAGVRALLGEAARLRARSMGAETMAGQYRTVYDELLRQHAAPLVSLS